MIKITDSVFEDQRIELDSVGYAGCTFRRCEIVYRGGVSHLENCGFEASTFHFDDAAGRTLSFLQELYRTPGGAAIIEATFPRGAGGSRSRNH